MVDIYKGVYIVNGFWVDFYPKKVTIAYIVNGTCLHCKLASEAPRATEGQCFQQTEGRPLDIKSVGQTVSYGAKIGLKYLDVKIYDVLDGLRKCVEMLSY